MKIIQIEYLVAINNNADLKKSRILPETRQIYNKIAYEIYENKRGPNFFFVDQFIINFPRFINKM